jgi:hypothetical protein
MIFEIIADHYLIFTMLFMQLRGLPATASEQAAGQKD